VAQFAESAVVSHLHHLLPETLARNSDELDPPKHKLFHTYGTTARVVFEPTLSSPYSGLFSRPAPGLARFSYAGPTAGVGLVPGLGLKFPLDGPRPSRNLLVMRRLDGQEQRSVFQHPFTNILPLPRATNLIMREVVRRFETVVPAGQGLHQPVAHLASVDNSGAPILEPRAPYRLIFAPTDAARRAAQPELDFRVDLAENYPPGMAIYDVLGLDEAAEQAALAAGATELEDLIPLAAPIGTLRTESRFVASAYGDYRLFFQHTVPAPTTLPQR
jgi:hypothetical protein